jgi:hypothetical protein
MKTQTATGPCRCDLLARPGKTLREPSQVVFD